MFRTGWRGAGVAVISIEGCEGRGLSRVPLGEVREVGDEGDVVRGLGLGVGVVVGVAPLAAEEEVPEGLVRWDREDGRQLAGEEGLEGGPDAGEVEPLGLVPLEESDAAGAGRAHVDAPSSLWERGVAV